MFAMGKPPIGGRSLSATSRRSSTMSSASICVGGSILQLYRVFNEYQEMALFAMWRGQWEW